MSDYDAVCGQVKKMGIWDERFWDWDVIRSGRVVHFTGGWMGMMDKER
jgi:hypothetical protein